MKVNVSEEYYDNHIPPCCQLQTVREHMDRLMLCWGLLHEMEAGIDTRKKECGRDCDLHIKHDPVLLAKLLKKGNG